MEIISEDLLHGDTPTRSSLLCDSFSVYCADCGSTSFDEGMEISLSPRLVPSGTQKFVDTLDLEAHLASGMSGLLGL